jgi:hypothetical protein
MAKYTHFTKLKHLIFPNGGSTTEAYPFTTKQKIGVSLTEHGSSLETDHKHRTFPGYTDGMGEQRQRDTLLPFPFYGPCPDTQTQETAWHPSLALAPLSLSVPT